MKKLFILGLSVAMIAGASSCKKTSKGKVSNEWTVSSYKSMDTWSDGTTVENIKDATTYTNTTKGTISGVSYENIMKGTIATNTMTISKDGTWSSMSKYTEGTANGTAIPNPETTTEEYSGTWSFIGKNKTGEFKKNERIMFVVLESSTTDSNGTDKETTTDLEGSVWKITTSKKKELVLEYEYVSTYTPAGGSTSTDKYNATMTLTQK